MDFAVPADHRIKLKECEKKDKYFDLARELKKLWNMQVTIIPIVIGAFGTVTKGLLKGLEDLEIGGWVETIQTNTLLKTARILRRVLATCGDLLSLKLQWKTLIIILIAIIIKSVVKRHFLLLFFKNIYNKCENVDKKIENVVLLYRSISFPFKSD